MSDDIRGLSAELAADPTSLVFLRLGEMLRQAGRLDAASKVVVQGLYRYPDLPEGHDLYARILVDRGELESAFDEWDMTLRLDPGHPGAQKGLGYLYFKAGDFPSALRHLRAVAAAHPEDERLALAINRVEARLIESEAGTAPSAPAESAVESLHATGVSEPAAIPGPASPPPPADVMAVRSDPLQDEGVLLVDSAGLRLLGSLDRENGTERADQVAAELAGVSREAARAVRLLNLGEWQSLALEASAGHFFLVPPTPETLLLAMRDASVPMGRVALGAGRALDAARRWLEEVR